MNSWILRVARWAYRGPLDNPRRAGRRLLVLLGLVPVLLFAVVAVFVTPQFAREFAKFGQAEPVLAYDYRQWHVVYGDSWNKDLAAADCQSDPLCLARPENPILWNSHYRRDDRDVHYERLSRMPGQTYWLGLRIGAADVARARALGLRHFILGSLNGTYEIYLNGRLFRQSTSEPSRHPLILSQLDVFPGALSAAGDLHLAIRVRHDLGSPYPDLLAENVLPGFATPEAVSFFSRADVFGKQSSPFFFAGIFFSLGIFLFLVWVTCPEKMEYSAVAAYALLHGVRSTLEMSLVYSQLGETTAAKLRVLLWGLEFSVVALLGLTLSRARFSLIGRVVPVLMALTLVPVFAIRNPFTMITVGEVVANGILLPLAFGLGAFFCYAQLRLLAADRLLAKLEESRDQRLRIYSAMFGVMAAAHLAYFLYFFRNFGIEPSFYRYTSVCFVVAMGALAVRRNGDLTQLMNRGIVSRYHRRLELPAKVDGCLLALDLKGSEALYRLGAAEGRGGVVVNECLARMWAVMVRFQGEVVDTQGDSMAVLFEGERAEAFARAVQAVAAIDESLRVFSAEVKALPQGRLHFRAAVTFGSLQPIWQTVQGTSQPGWIEAEGSNPFVDASRLLELEKELNGRDSSMLVLDALSSAELVGAAEGVGFVCTFRNRACVGKHEKLYSVTGLRVSGEDALKLSA